MYKPILRQFDRSLLTIIETDASNQVITKVLFQYYEQTMIASMVKILHPIEYHSRTFDSVQ